MKILLPFNLIAHLEGTGIASSFGLKNRPPENHTLVELSTRDAHDLMELLKGLEAELLIRSQKWQQQASKFPIVAIRRSAVEQRLQGVRQAVELLSR